MNRFAWRQHRKQFLIMGVALALFAALVIPTGLHFWHVYQQALTTCKQNPATPSCGDLSGNLLQSNIDQTLLHLLPLSVILLPLVFGMFWGAPLLAKEYAEGTNSLTWTQSVSRRKWLTVKLAWVLFATALFLGAFAALTTWWSKTPNTLNLNRFGVEAFFASQGLVPVAYGLFAVAFGIMFGAWFRKTMVAVGLVLGLFVACTLVTVPNFVRPHYMVPITVTAPMGPNLLDNKIPAGAWTVSRNIVDKNGKTLNSFSPSDMPTQCAQLTQDIRVPDGSRVAKLKASGIDPVDDCLNNAGYHQIGKYQPATRYWDFQRIESGIYLGLAALAVCATYWLVLRRDA